MNQSDCNKNSQKSKFLMLDERITSDPRFYKMGAAMGLYIKLRTFSDKSANLSVRPSCKNLAKFIGCSLNTVTNQLKQLVALGWLEIEHRFNDSNVYSFPLERLILISDSPPISLDPLPQKTEGPSPPENCELTRLTLKLDLNKSNHIIPSPEPTYSITMPNYETNQNLSNDMIDILKYLSGKAQAAKAAADLLALITPNYRQKAIAYINDWNRRRDYGIFYTRCLRDYVTDTKGIENKSAYIYKALTNPDGLEKVMDEAHRKHRYHSDAYYAKKRFDEMYPIVPEHPTDEPLAGAAKPREWVSVAEELIKTLSERVA